MKTYRLTSTLGRLLMLLVIRQLYVFLTVNTLEDLWYVGYGSYGVDFNIQKETFGILLFILMAVFFVNMQKKGLFLDSLITMLFVIYYMPMNAAYAINDTEHAFFIKSNLYFFLLLLFVNVFIKKINSTNVELSIPQETPLSRVFSSPRVKLICTGICLFCIVYKIFYNGFSFSISLNSDDIYSTRDEFQSSMNAISGSLFSYIFSIVRNLADYIAPMYFYYSLVQKKYAGAFISFFCILSLFSISSSKVVLIFMAIVLIVAVLRKTVFVEKFCQCFVWGMFFLLLICVIESIAFDSNEIYMFLVRRIFYYPAWLNSLYYDFFNQGAKVLWTQDAFLLQMVLPAQYPEGILNAINNYFYQGYVPSPNTGLFAEAYMHFGNFGILLYPMLLTTLLNFSQKTFFAYGNELSILVAAKLVLQLTNVPIVRTDFILSFVLFAILFRNFSKVPKVPTHDKRLYNLWMKILAVLGE